PAGSFTVRRNSPVPRCAASGGAISASNQRVFQFKRWRALPDNYDREQSLHAGRRNQKKQICLKPLVFSRLNRTQPQAVRALQFIGFGALNAPSSSEESEYDFAAHSVHFLDRGASN